MTIGVCEAGGVQMMTTSMSDRIRRSRFYRIRDPFLGWGSRTTGGVELISVDSRHMDLLREPYVHRLAEKLADSLGRVGSRSGDYGSERVRDLIDGT